MKYIHFIFIFAISTVVFSSNTFFLSEKSFGQVISTGEEESNVYLQISNILDDTQNKTNELVQAIKSGNIENAIDIASNITMNIQEVRLGVNLLVDNPIKGGD
ncbi:MAG: hypothetical protein R3321_07170 [Nitrososphaeraceae archaeon]|nr:hypothetical protein [Nitrososphaeraceae archaeon]